MRRRRLPGLVFALSAGWLVLLVALAAFANVLPIADYGDIVGGPAQPPFAAWPEFLGTDTVGRSVLSRLIYGARLSLTVGFASVAIGVVIGGLLGLLAAHFRRRTEAGVDIVADSILAFPPLLLLLALVAVLQPSLPTLVFALGALMIPPFIRLVKANALAQAGREYILAARALGAGDGRLIFREIVPNVTMAVVSYSIIMIAVLIVVEGSLSFLGYGIPPPRPSWGGMIADGKDRLAIQPYLVFVPVAVMFLTVFSLNAIGDRLRKRFDISAGKL